MWVVSLYWAELECESGLLGPAPEDRDLARRPERHEQDGEQRDRSVADDEHAQSRSQAELLEPGEDD